MKEIVRETRADAKGWAVFPSAFRNVGRPAPVEVEKKIADIILSDPDVTDINKIRIIQEGRTYHVEGAIELRKGLTLAQAIEDNGVLDWQPQED